MQIYRTYYILLLEVLKVTTILKRNLEISNKIQMYSPHWVLTWEYSYLNNKEIQLRLYKVGLLLTLKNLNLKLREWINKLWYTQQRETI